MRSARFDGHGAFAELRADDSKMARVCVSLPVRLLVSISVYQRLLVPVVFALGFYWCLLVFVIFSYLTPLTLFTPQPVNSIPAHYISLQYKASAAGAAAASPIFPPVPVLHA